ncbi:hypothetical protein ACKWTF_016239 [Chironomus riparius]
MQMQNIFWSLSMFTINILMKPQSSLSVPIKFFCNKTDAGENQNAFLCQFDIQTNQRSTELKSTLNHFTMSINAITGIMLAMIIVIFVSTIFNIIRFRNAIKSHSSSPTSLNPQRQSRVIEGSIKGNADIDNNYEIPITDGSGIRQADGDDYLRLEPVEESLYEVLDHEKELTKKGITTISVKNSVYNEIDNEVTIDDNLYDAVENEKESAIDNVAYGILDNHGDRARTTLKK